MPTIASLMSPTPPSVTNGSGMMALWSLRLLLEGDLWRTLLGQHRFAGDETWALLGIDNDELGDLDDDARYQLLVRRRRELEQSPPELGQPLRGNLDELHRVFALNEQEQAVLAFLVLRESSQIFADMVCTSNRVSRCQLQRSISTALRMSYSDVRKALAPSGMLFQAGFVTPGGLFGDALELDDGLTDQLLYDDEVVEGLLQRYSYRAPAALVQWHDFDYWAEQRDLIHDYLHNACRQRQTGVNVLLHGAPGTGKTQLVRLLAMTLGAELQEVRCNDLDDMPISQQKRFSAYRYCQRMLKDKTDTLILFDEIEDVFGFDGSRGQKAWVNHLLENNPLPAFWLTNSVNCLDPAFIRRFDLVLEMPELDDSQRGKLAKVFFSDVTLSETWLDEVSRQPAVQPGHFHQAAKVVGILGDADAQTNEQRLKLLLDESLRAQGLPWLPTVPIQKSCFEPHLANADRDLTRLAEGLRRSAEGRICLYGPSGTGKSEYARYLAASLECPLIAVSGSDLLQPWVGFTEQAIAAAFADAEKRKAVLLFDEADTWLPSRMAAGPHWQKSQVNEFLQQLERFSGVVVLTTNRLPAMDGAVLRRLDLKVAFNFLQPAQAWAFFCQLIGPDSEDEAKGLQASLAALSLTPGDFACVQRRMRIMGSACNAFNVLAALREEHQLRNQHDAVEQGAWL